MRVFRLFLALLLLTSLTFSCARRKKARLAAEATPAVAPTPMPTPSVAPTAAHDLTDVMTTELHLTPAQQTKVRAILTGTVGQVNAARQQYGSNRPALTQQLQRINASSEAQLKAALTPTQYQQYQSRKRQMQTQMQTRKPTAH